MKYLIGVLLILFASYADIFLYRIGIAPAEPSLFFIPIFLVICLLRYSILDIWDLLRSHSTRFLAAILFLSSVYACISPASVSVITTRIALDLITFLMYIFTVQFFRSEPKKLVILVLVFAFITISGSVWYDYFVGLPKFKQSLEEMLRKGGFGENPNQAASAIKFLALGILVFLHKFKLKKTLLITAMVITVFLTFSRSGIVSIILILVLGTANNWNPKFNINPSRLFKSFFSMFFLFVSLYIGLVSFAGFLKNEFPELGRGAMGDRIDLLLGNSEKSVIAEDVSSSGGRGNLFLMYLNKSINNPFGHGTGYTEDGKLVDLNTHNYYLFLAVNFGLLALILYLIYFWTGFRISLRQNQFYYLIFLALLFFEGFISHSIFQERALLISLAFFDSLIYNKEHKDLI